jgi:hypothetical protein
MAGLLILGLGLQGCLATTVAGATLGVAGAAVKTTAKAAKVSAKVAGGAVRVTAHVGRRAVKGTGEQKPAGS